MKKAAGPDGIVMEILEVWDNLIDKITDILNDMYDSG